MASRSKRVIVAVTSLVLALSIAACGKAGNNGSHVARASKKHDPDKLMQYFAKPDQQMVGVLAVKYNVQPATVESLLDQYLTKTDYTYRSFKLKSQGANTANSGNEDVLRSITKDKKFYSKTIEVLASRFNVPPATTASIIFDYLEYEAFIKEMH